MALFTDGGPATIEDMKRHDSACESLARDAGIDLDAKLSVAAEEVGQDLFAFLLFQGAPETRARRRSVGLTDVVATPPVTRWHAIRALAGLYRDAYGSDVNDRFRQKWQEYERMSKDASEHAFDAGIGLSMHPIPKPPVPLVNASGDETGTTQYLRVTWVGDNGEEGAASDEFATALVANDSVSMRGVTPEGVVGWNIYAGVSDDALFLQNDSPLAPGATWAEPVEGLKQGRLVSVNGQTADYFVVEQRVLLRG